MFEMDRMPGASAIEGLHNACEEQRSAACVSRWAALDLFHQVCGLKNRSSKIHERDFQRYESVIQFEDFG
jgi:hypothetical protein